MNPKVGIVVPTLNSERTLANCLASIRNQTYSEIRVVVVDGGSSDRTTKIAEEFHAHVVEKPCGRSEARAMGAQAADGDFLLFLDSDQRLEPGVVEECVDLADNCPEIAVAIPETDEACGIWAKCREMDLGLARVAGLEYPRFYSSKMYTNLGAHTPGLLYLEDRELFLRFRDAGGQMVTCRSQIINQLGYVNPVQLGIKTQRYASDAETYYSRYAPPGESIWSITRPRFVALAHGDIARRANLLPLLLLPIYELSVNGPKLARAAIASFRTTLGFSRR